MSQQTDAGAGIKVRSWRELRRGQWRGFVTVDLPCGLQISDIAILEGPDGPWVRLPQMPRVRDGVQLKNERGQPIWTAPIVWQSRRLANEFGAAVIAIVREKYPEALEPAATSV